MTHLGTQLSALADAQLGPAPTARAMAHVAVCPECADGLAAARAARLALTSAVDVRPAADLTARLLALGAGQQAPPSDARARLDPAAPWADDRCVPLPGARGLPGARDGLPPGGLRGEVHPRRPPIAAMAAGALGVGLVAVIFALGGEPTATPDQHPAQALGLLSRAAAAVDSPALAIASVDQSSAGSSLGLVDTAGLADVPGFAWAQPVPVPTGYRPAGVRTHAGQVPAIEVDLLGPHGLLVVTQRLARLDETAVDGVETRIGDRTVLVLSRSPWQAVWQSGDVMVDVVAEVPSDAVDDLVSAASVRAYDDGAQARLVRGWQNLVTSWSSP